MKTFNILGPILSEQTFYFIKYDENCKPLILTYSEGDRIVDFTWTTSESKPATFYAVYSYEKNAKDFNPFSIYFYNIEKKVYIYFPMSADKLTADIEKPESYKVPVIVLNEYNIYWPYSNILLSNIEYLLNIFYTYFIPTTLYFKDPTTTKLVSIKEADVVSVWFAQLKILFYTNLQDLKNDIEYQYCILNEKCGDKSSLTATTNYGCKGICYTAENPKFFTTQCDFGTIIKKFSCDKSEETPNTGLIVGVSILIIVVLAIIGVIIFIIIFIIYKKTRPKKIPPNNLRVNTIPSNNLLINNRQPFNTIPSNNLRVNTIPSNNLLVNKSNGFIE